MSGGSEKGKSETGAWNCKSCLEIKIEELMTREVVTVHEDALLEEIFTLFEKYLYHTLPVLNSRGELAGIIDQDIVLEILLFAHIPRAKHTHLVAVRSLGVHAKDVMITHPVTIPPGSTLIDAAEMMMKHRFDRVCVTEKGKLVGVISKRDIVREVSRRRALEMG
ncbi:HPP family protein [Methanosarcina sp. KYL-1]|uniref:CBS domain-containing protein n=1 Tax=Methanosarcina sp. KYL-1 TaxID=2602068 RepID=UPI00210156BD|nr:CBS domain-containing protein [Methanosarcina sp. KYL-1]